MSAEVDIFVCVSCTSRGESSAADPRPGAGLAKALAEHLTDLRTTGISVREVECLAVCKRPSTIALAADGKWTYIVGDLETESHVADIVATAQAFQRSANGIIPWAERPQPFRKGVIARVPPLGFEQPATEKA
jgi:predicted metal-binding protein